MSCGVGTPSVDFNPALLVSSRMISMHSSTHSSQMNTVGPAISFRTSCWLLPQKLQYRVFLLSPPELVAIMHLSRSRSRFSASPAVGPEPHQVPFRRYGVSLGHKVG